MKLGSSRGMDTKRPRGSERSKPRHELQLTRRSQPPYPWPPEQAQPGVSKPCRTTLAARAGNLALVEQLLERGADADLVDDYGHTAWMGALNRAIDDHAFGKAHLGALFERLGPDTLDVHADGRLVRLERGQGEFWLLGLMLAGLKTHAGGLFARPLGPQRHMRGFFSDSLLRTL